MIAFPGTSDISFLFDMIALGNPQAVIFKEQTKGMETDQEQSKKATRLKKSNLEKDPIPVSLSSIEGNNRGNNQQKYMSVE